MKCRHHTGAIVDAWRNTDNGEPIPAWMNDVACWLTGGRFAIETQFGTMIAELGDFVIHYDGTADVCPQVVFEQFYECLETGEHQ